MEDIPSDSMQSEPKHSYLFPSNSSLLESGNDIMRSEEGTQNDEHGKVSPQAASQTLWSTGTLTGHIQNGFYSVIPDKILKEHFLTIPTPDDLSSLGRAALKAEIVIVDAEKDKKLSMLKQLTAALVKGLNSNPASLVKKIAGLVVDFYKRPDPELNPAKSSIEEISSNSIESRGRLLGQIKNGSCRPRAILFKVLADSVGLKTKLIEGIPSDGVLEYMESYKHLSVVVVLNSVELLVDLMRFPGQLIPVSDRAISMSHITAAEDESVEYDSCDSPLEPNSPVFGFTDRKSGKCSDKNEFLLSMYQRRFDGQSNLPDPSLRNLLLKSSSERNYSSSHSVPNIANAFWRGNRRRAAIEQQIAYSSSEDPLSSTSTQSTISNKQHLTREYTDDVGASSPDDQLSRTSIQSTMRNNHRSTTESTDGIGASRSEGASASGRRRSRRRSTSVIPEIGDDVVRAVRGMNETLKQNRLLNRQIGEGYEFHSQNAKDADDLSKDVSSCHMDGPPAYNVLNRQINPDQKAVSLPSSPLHPSHRNSEISQSTDFMTEKDLMATWSQVLHSSPFRNKPLLPFEDWNIDFSELTVGARVGIGFFGEVFRGTWYGTDVAIKVFLEQDLTVENMVDFCNEVSIMSRLRHPNVILFLGACMKPPHLSMVTEYMEMGSLYYLVHMSGQKKKISWRRRLKMLRDICRGLMCMHRMKIVHRDLKSANCLVNKHWVVKICDFGLSRILTEEPMNDNTSAGTPEWMAPELMRSEAFTEKCDIFSLGVIMWELCTLTRPWEGIPPVQVVYEVSNKGTRLEIPEGPLGRLISDCWKEPEERPSCQEILTRLLECEYALC